MQDSENLLKNKGKKWSNDEQKKLYESWVNETPINIIANEHQRTTGGIKSQIISLAYKDLIKSGKTVEDIASKYKLEKTDLDEAILQIKKNDQINEHKKVIKGIENLKELKNLINDDTELNLLKNIRNILIEINDKINLYSTKCT